MDFYTALLQIRVLRRVVYEFGKLSLSHLAGTVPEHKKERIDGI
jgi:hypothetical protein